MNEATTLDTGNQAMLQTAEAAAGERRQDLLRLISSLTASRNRLGELEREQDRLAYAVGQLEQERARLEARRVETRSRFEAASADSQAAAARAEELEGERHRVAGERAAVQEQATAARHEAEGLAHAGWELRHRLTGVEREQARHLAVVEQLTAVLPEEVVTGQVIDFLNPEPGVAAALDRVWREWLELPVVTRPPSAAERSALAGLEGRLRLAVSGDAPSVAEAPTPEGVAPLLERAGVPPEQRAWLTRVLPPAFQCEDGAEAQALAERLPHALVLEPDGTLWQGRTVEPPTVGTRLRGALALREARADLRGQLEDVTRRAEAAAGRSREAERRLAELDARLAEVGRALVDAEQERARAMAVEQSLGQELHRLERELEALHAEAERNRRAKTELASRRAELAADVERLQVRNVAAERAVEEAAARVEGLRNSAAEALRRRDRWQAEARLAEERVAAAGAEHQRLEEERGTLAARLVSLEAEIATAAAELAATEDEVVCSRTRLAEEQGLLAAARERERGLGERVDQTAARVAKLEEEVRSRRRTHEVAREALHAAEVEQTRLDGEWRRLRDAALADVGATPEQLLRPEAVADDRPEGLREAVDELRTRLEGLGPVNLLAVREAEELGTRLDFLRTQRQDLVDALHSLEETIRDIDVTCRERFVATFEQVNVVFAQTFVELFGGGSARLELVDEEDPLESGIDIVAQPPGKRTQSVQLLSGGEKALTALSLLIALFRIKPSPFCVLDEVDAPLDDANVERLADLIQAMTEHTQFVLITHNRRTMAHADALYGVTMEEPGVSKVVSVRLEE